MIVAARVDLDQLTVGDIWKLAELTRAASNVGPDTKVNLYRLQDEVVGFEIDLEGFEYRPPSELPGVVLDAYEAQTLAGVLETVIHQDGDARNHLDEMKEWLHRLMRPYQSNRADH
jgi:hypothetical protein